MSNIRQPRYKQIYENKPEMAENAALFWSEIVSHLKDNSLVTKTRLGQADRLCRAKVEYEKYYPVAVAEGPVKRGPNGGDVFNFTWSAVEKLQERIAKLEDMLLISPKAAEGKLAAKPKHVENKFLKRV